MTHRILFADLARAAFLAMATLAVAMPLAAEEAVEVVPTLTTEELRDRYALPNSRYLEADGMEIHYVDEGEGPVVVLLHASYHSLRTWDALAARLRDNYRVVRFDFPTAGLSVDRKTPPAEKFSMMGRYVDTVEHVVEHLGLERFALVATSSGGSTGFRYANRNPDRVERLVLINTAGMPRIPRTDPLRERAATSKWAGMRVRPREFWEVGLSANFFEIEPPAWIIDQAYDYARREGRADEAANYAYSTGDPQRILGGITSPTLIMWGMNNPTVMHLEADVIQHWLTAAPSAIRKYPGLGHYPYIEALDRIYPDLSAFLAGDMDAELRRTTMLPADADCDCS